MLKLLFGCNNSVYVCVFVQLSGCGEAALHAHPPTQTPGAENRRPVHSETTVRSFSKKLCVCHLNENS